MPPRKRGGSRKKPDLPKVRARISDAPDRVRKKAGKSGKNPDQKTRAQSKKGPTMRAGVTDAPNRQRERNAARGGRTKAGLFSGESKAAQASAKRRAALGNLGKKLAKRGGVAGAIIGGAALALSAAGTSGQTSKGGKSNRTQKRKPSAPAKSASPGSRGAVKRGTASKDRPSAPKGGFKDAGRIKTPKIASTSQFAAGNKATTKDKPKSSQKGPSKSPRRLSAFETAFATARKGGRKTFRFGGKTFTTELKKKKK